MSDEARIERLTQLARRVWPNAHVAQCGDAVVVDADYEPRFPLQVHHPRALDALEAALLVLSMERPDSARHVYSTAPPAWVEQLAERWDRAAEACVEKLSHSHNLPGSLYAEIFLQCARELRERARKP